MTAAAPTPPGTSPTPGRGPADRAEGGVIEELVAAGLLVVAATLSVGGATLTRDRRRSGRRTDVDAETATVRAVVALVLLAAAAALGTVGATMVAAGRSWSVQAAAYSAAAVIVGLPLVVTRLLSARRGGGR